MILTVSVICLAAYAGCLFWKIDFYYTVRNVILCLMTGLVVVFSYQAGRISGGFSYDDGEHPGRFLLLYLCGLVCAFIFINLPVTGWMFLFFYVALSRVSDSITGMCSGTSLLMLTTVFCQQISLSSFLVYFLSGMVGIALFAERGEESHIAIPLCLSLGTQLLLIFAGELLIQNKKLVWEQALIPLANTVMNGILLCIFLQYYLNKVARKVSNRYIMINDPEYEAMTKMREKSEEDYFHAVHTVYLTERIASELGLDVPAAKCAAYYNRLGKEEWEHYPFPDHALSLLGQLQDNARTLKEKEAVVVLICDNLITTVQHMNKQGKEKKAGYEQMINQFFEKRFTIEALADTDITLGNLRYIRKRLLEEKMYYEFMV